MALPFVRDLAFLSPHIPNCTVSPLGLQLLSKAFLFFILQNAPPLFFSSQPTQNYPSGLTSSENISSRCSSHLTACQRCGFRGCLFLLTSLCDSRLYFSAPYSTQPQGWDGPGNQSLLWYQRKCS